MDHTVLPANYTMPAFTPYLQSITTLWLVLILPGKMSTSQKVVIYHPTEGRRLSQRIDDGQHQHVERTPHGRVSQNDRGQRYE